LTSLGAAAQVKNSAGRFLGFHFFLEKDDTLENRLRPRLDSRDIDVYQENLVYALHHA
jgi:hypothetical protein